MSEENHALLVLAGVGIAAVIALVALMFAPSEDPCGLRASARTHLDVPPGHEVQIDGDTVTIRPPRSNIAGAAHLIEEEIRNPTLETHTCACASHPSEVCYGDCLVFTRHNGESIGLDCMGDCSGPNCHSDCAFLPG